MIQQTANQNTFFTLFTEKKERNCDCIIAVYDVPKRGIMVLIDKCAVWLSLAHQTVIRIKMMALPMFLAFM